MHHTGEVALAKQKAHYEAELKSQYVQRHTIELSNSKMHADIDEARLANARLRKRANSYTKACKKVRADIKRMQLNISTAMDFMENTLSASDEMLNAPELEVMA